MRSRTSLSFGFAGKDFLAISIETRRERHESYSTVAGFFKQYELYYVVADERDLIGLRTNYRKDPPEDFYLYRTRAPPDNARRLFLDYIREINRSQKSRVLQRAYDQLHDQHSDAYSGQPGRSPLSWKVLLSGYIPQYLYERSGIDTSLPLEELKRRSHINAAAQAADTAPDFSQRIRATLPMPPKVESR